MNFKLMLTGVGAFVLGLAVQGLHAQMTPPAYVVAVNYRQRRNGYKNEFLPPVLKVIADLGGKYVAGGFNKTMSLKAHHHPTVSSLSNSIAWTR